MSSWGSPLLDPKKLQNEQFYIIDWIWKKLLVDVANLATCCHDDYDVLLEVLGSLRKCYISSPVAKALVLDWKSWLAQLFLDVFLGLTLTGPKKASKSTILHNRLNKEQNSWSKLPIWLLAAMMIMMYYWRFWQPCANAMLVVALVSQRGKQLGQARGLRPQNGEDTTGKESFSANARARWRKGCETKETILT